MPSSGIVGPYGSFGASQMALAVKNPPANAWDMGSTSGLGKSPKGGHGNPLQYSRLENTLDRGAWQARVRRVVRSQTQLKWLNTRAHIVDLLLDF